MSQVQPNEESIFELARQIESPKLRADYLEQVCLGDQPLRARVAELLKYHDQAQSFMQRPAVDVAATVDSPVTEKPGDLVGPFKLLQQIGAGGFGVVYMAEQSNPVRRKVALKIIKPGMDTKEVVARFEAERQALAMMDHPNIAKILDGGETSSGRPYFVMELVKGVPLTEYCDEQMLSTQDRLSLFTQVCNAIEHAHQKGIIHRDIKPSNVMVTLHDGLPVPKVIDFGVSKCVSQQLTAKTLFTNYGQMIGTPQYMSPEQAEMSGLDVDTRSDIYSLGVLLYELLTGTTPLEASRLRSAGYAEMQRIIKEEEPPKPSTRVSGNSQQLSMAAKQRRITPDALRKALAGDLDWIVMKAMDKDRNRRYETASGLVSDIRRFVNSEPVVAGPPTTAYRVRKFVQRNRAAVTTAASIGLLLAAGVATLTAAFIHVRSLNNDLTFARDRAIESQSEAETQAIIAHDAVIKETKRSRELQSQQYISDMNSASLALVEGDFIRIRTLLDRYGEGAPMASERKFEWYYLDRLCREVDATPKLITESPAKSVAVCLDNYVVVAGLSGTIAAYQNESPEFGRQLRRIGSHQAWHGANWGGFLLARPLHSEVLIFARFGEIIRWNFVTDKVSRFGNADDEEWIVDAAFSRDGKTMASLDKNGNISVWDADTCQELGKLPELQDGRFTSIAFSPNGRHLALGQATGELSVYDFNEGKTLRTLDLPAKNIRRLAYSESGKLLAASDDEGQIFCFDLEILDSKARILAGHSNEVLALLFLKDSDTLISGGYDNTIRVWSRETDVPVRTIKAHSGYVFSLDQTEDASTLVSSGKDFCARFWNVSELRRKNSIVPAEWIDSESIDDRGWVTNVQFDSSGANSVTATVGKAICTTQQGQLEAQTLPFKSASYRSLAVSRTGSIATVSRDSLLQVYSPGSGIMHQNLRHDLPSVGPRTSPCMAFNSSGRRLVVGMNDNVVLFDADNLHAVWSSQVDDLAIQCVCFSPDQELLAVAGAAGIIRILSTDNGRLVNELKGHREDVVSLCFSSDGKQLASGGYDHTVRLWQDWRQAEYKVSELVGHTATVRGLKFFPDGKTLCSAGSDQTIKFWDIPTSQLRFTLFASGTVESIDISRDGNLLVSGGRDKAITFWSGSSQLQNSER